MANQSSIFMESTSRTPAKCATDITEILHRMPGVTEVTSVFGAKGLLAQPDVRIQDVAVFRLLAGERRLTHEEMGRQLKMSGRTVARSIVRLAQAGAVELRRTGRANDYRVRPPCLRRGPQSEGLAPVDVAPIREAVEEATRERMAPSDPLPAALAEIGARAGAGVRDVAVWVAEKAHRRRIRSAGFFLYAAREEFGDWWEWRRAQSRAQQAARERDCAQALASWQSLAGGPPCRWCGGATKLLYSGRAACRSCANDFTLTA